MYIFILIEEVHGYYNDYDAVRGVFSTYALAEEGKAKLLLERSRRSVGYSSDWEITRRNLDEASEE